MMVCEAPKTSPWTDRSHEAANAHLVDHIGGHIKGSMNFPSSSLDASLPTLLRKLEDKETVVFHCALSQQRGPGAALRYMRAREQRVQEKPRAEAGNAESAGGEDRTSQKVYVLDRGFVGWQELYGKDERLTEAYVSDLWEDFY